MKVTVVIPAFNEEENIANCLDSLTLQKTDYPFEVIVVDNDSSDNTVNTVKSYRKSLNLRLISEKRKGRGMARFTGFLHAEGEIILSTDADTVLPPDWIQKLVDEINKDNATLALTGPCHFRDCGLVRRVILNFAQPAFMVGYRIVFGHYWLSGFNFSVKKSAYIKAGEFNPNLNTLEDVELAFRLAKIGRIGYISTRVLVSGRRFKQGMIKGTWSYIRPFLQLYLLKRNDVYLNDVR
jgi:glycosyltransferase involved in cell wall biosynthesis